MSSKTDDKQTINALEWQDDHLKIIDQTFLPDREVFISLFSVGQVWDAIRQLKVRGAPAIGIAGAYGLYLGIKDANDSSFDSLHVELNRFSDYLLSSRPTAVNLQWALERIATTVHANRDKPAEDIKEIILQTAITIHNEDRRLCKMIGEYGAELVPNDAKILTHCNTGSLATGQYGTAFSVILHANQNGSLKQVWVDETRPLMQGSRLTAWELKKEEIPFRVITDSTAGFLMQQGQVDMIVVGADRIASNGDTANKIGTYSLAVLAKEHEIPFYVAAPYSTVDFSLATGEEIPIEERDKKEITHIMSSRVAPKKTDVYNPAFDITPNRYITGIITDKGVITPPFSENLKKMLDPE